MKKVSLPILFTLMVTFGLSQKKALPPNLRQIETAVLEEGKKLYQLERASEFGMATFREQLNELSANAAGYFSYKDNKVYKCVFFNSLYNAEIIATISFDSAFNPKRIAVNPSTRPMTSAEKDIYAIRQKVIDDLKRDTVMFKMYTGTSISILPLIEENVRKVFAITLSKDPTAVIFGNDYVAEFDSRNNMISKKTLHTELTALDCFETKHGEEDVSKVTHIHKAETGDFITSTDICTLLLNQKRANWKHHVVKAPNYVSIWDCDANELQTVTRKKWNKYNYEDEQPDEEPVAVSQKK